MDTPQTALPGNSSASSSRRLPPSDSSGGASAPASSSPLPSRSTSIRRRKPTMGMEISASGSGSGSHSQAPSSASTPGSTSGLRASAGRSSRSGRDRASTGTSSGRRTKDRHSLALESIRHFLKGRSSYDMLPVSFRLVVLDTQLVVGPALEVMWSAGVVSAPLWHSLAPPSTSDDSPLDSMKGPLAGNKCDRPLEPASAPAATSTAASAQSPSPGTTPPLEGRVAGSIKPPNVSRSKPGFAGMLTVNDIIHLIQYYYHHASYDTAKKEVETFRLEGLRDIEAALSVPPPPLLSCHPLRPLLEACQLLMKTHARRLPLLDYDEQTGMEAVVSVLTQYRILKFIAMNCRETASLHRSIRSLGVGTFVSTYKPRPGTGSRRGSGRIDPILTAPGPASAFSQSEDKDAIPPLPPVPADLKGEMRDSRPHFKESSGSHSRSGSQEQTPKQELVEQFFNFTPFAGQVTEPSAEDARSNKDDDVTACSTASSTTASISGGGNRTIPTPTAPPSDQSSNPYHPIYTATLDTTVFDVVHMFSERGISAVPIVDEDGSVVDMYETVDVITLVRTGAYQDLDLTIRSALTRRPPDFPGVYSCSPEDSVANIFALLRRRRVHRLLIVEPEPEEDAPLQGTAEAPQEGAGEEIRAGPPRSPAELEEMLEKQGPRVRTKKGKLVGILALSDLLRHIIGIPSSRGGADGSMGRRRSSEGTTVSTLNVDDDAAALATNSSRPASQTSLRSNTGGSTLPIVSSHQSHSHAPLASAAPTLSPVPHTGQEDATITEGVALETARADVWSAKDGGEKETPNIVDAARASGEQIEDRDQRMEE